MTRWLGSAAAWPAGARSWLISTVSLVLAINIMYSRGIYSDAYYDLYAGRYIAQHGIPHTNVVTAAAHGAPWIDQQWLAHLAFYGTWAVGGYPALGALSAVLVTAGFAVLALLMLCRRVRPVWVFVWVLAALAACMGQTWIQAQSFGYPLFALTLWLIVTDSQAPRLRARTWLVVPVLVLWANIHGSVLLGLGMVAGYSGYRTAKALLAGEPRAVTRYVALAAAAAAALVCTPYGPGVIGYYRSLLGNPLLSRYLTEWAPPAPANPLSWAFFALAGTVTLVVTVAWWRGTRPDPVAGGIALVLLALALIAVRNQVWFAFGGSLLAADTLARRHHRPTGAEAFRRALAVVLAGLAVWTMILLAATPVSQFVSRSPVRAVTVAAQIAARNHAQRVLGDWSGTLMLWLDPAMFGRVGFDVRMEQYTREQLTAYFSFLNLQEPHWQRVMNGYQIVVVTRQAYPRLARTLVKLPGWRVAYESHDGLVLVRRGRAARA